MDPGNNNYEQAAINENAHFSESKFNNNEAYNQTSFSRTLVRSILHLLCIFLLYAAVICIVVFTRLGNINYTPPGNQYLFPPLTTVKNEMIPPSVNVSSYRADVAYEHLRYLARTPHPWNTAANKDNLDYITM
ncbi:hypothetical protein BB561_006652, partial [Smittium simulii]